LEGNSIQTLGKTLNQSNSTGVAPPQTWPFLKVRNITETQTLSVFWPTASLFLGAANGSPRISKKNDLMTCDRPSDVQRGKLPKKVMTPLILQ
jgi:hypothetical protein